MDEPSEAEDKWALFPCTLRNCDVLSIASGLVKIKAVRVEGRAGVVRLYVLRPRRIPLKVLLGSALRLARKPKPEETP
jgi:hypothetical protein